KLTVEAATRGYISADPGVRRSETNTERRTTLIFKCANAAADRNLTRLIIITDLASCHRQRDTATLFISHIRDAVIHRIDAIIECDKAARSESAGGKIARRIA